MELLRWISRLDFNKAVEVEIVLSGRGIPEFETHPKNGVHFLRGLP